ncbi:diaminopimelate decarboxylase [Elusimicrobiota bacterium]
MQLKEDYIRNNLEYKDNILHLNGINLREVAGEFGTPLYVYDMKGIKENCINYQKAFDDIEHIICYAVKANYNGAIIKLLASMGTGADVVSGGELQMALRAGIDPSKIVFAGVGKTEDEIRLALENDICLINVESRQELEAVGRIAADMKKTAGIAFRVNPDIDPKTHPKIATGLKESKFGIPAGTALEVYEEASKMEYVEIRGIHLHIGSQITDMEPFRLAAESAVEFTDKLKEKGIKIKYIDIGGGLGIGYESREVPVPENIAECIRKFFAGREEILIMEPGRSIVGNAGYLLTKVNYVKEGDNKSFVVVDAGFNDLIRPAMYGAYHSILPVEDSDESIVADIVGPVCESGDVMAANRKIKGARQGNILAICDSGAYGFSMSSNYNSRLRPAEVIVSEEGVKLVRRREKFEDLIRTENE